LKLALYRFEIIRPIGRNANAKFKAAPIFRRRISKLFSTSFCVLSLSMPVQNCRQIVQTVNVWKRKPQQII